LLFPDCGGLKNSKIVQSETKTKLQDHLEKVSIWPIPNPSPMSHVIAVPHDVLLGFSNEHLLGAFDLLHDCYGTSLVGGESNSLVIFADDPITPEKDGFYEGEPMYFKLFDPVTKTESSLTAEFDPSLPDYDGTFKINGLSAIRSFKVASSSVHVFAFEDVRIFPNPATDKLTIDLGKNENADIQFLNIHGQIIKQESFTNPKTTVDISDLPLGLYLVEINLPNFKLTKRFIKN